MPKKEDKIISIKGDKQSPYSQVIFIMKKHEHKTKPVQDFVQEAEKIIEGYINSKKEILSRKLSNTYVQDDDGIKKLIVKNSKIEDIILGCAALISSIGILMLLMTFFI